MMHFFHSFGGNYLKYCKLAKKEGTKFNPDKRKGGVGEFTLFFEPDFVFVCLFVGTPN